MMANLHSYYGFFAAILVLAAGTAFFKPALQGSIAQNLNKENASLGWGVFYWVVNVGAFAAPFISTVILGKPHSLAEGWQTLFYACAAFHGVQPGPAIHVQRRAFRGLQDRIDRWQVLKRTIVNIFEDPADHLAADHVVLLADDVSALGPAPELHYRLGG